MDQRRQSMQRQQQVADGTPAAGAPEFNFTAPPPSVPHTALYMLELKGA
jgi:hypothetical protein